MKLRLMGLSVGVAAGAVTVAGCGLERPEPACVVARASSDGSTGSFAATYTLKQGQNPDAQCARLGAEAVGLQKFYSQSANAPDTVGIRSTRMGQLASTFASRPDPDTSHTLYSVGPLATEAPGPDNFCTVPELTAAALDVPATATLPAQSFRYGWSNLRIYNTPGIPGTQFAADLSYSENGCTAEYTVKGIWPVVSCRNATTRQADDKLCDPYANPEEGRLRGSGINPLFPVKCDPVALICVLTGDVPSQEP